MSNAVNVQPPPRSASIAAPDGNRSDSSTFETGYDTSLLTSSSQECKEDTLNTSDHKADGKQKRKRTSTKDQAILETEYKENPKPNKAARAVIVQKVDLNEKEVQIWFQNRRQINRRKSRPLLPHEVAAFGLGGMMALSSDPVSGTLPSGGHVLKDIIHHVTSGLDQGDSTGEEIDISNHQDATRKASLPEPVEVATAKEARESSENIDSLSSTIPSLKSQSSFQDSYVELVSSSIPKGVGASFPSTPGYLANRWNLANSSFSTPSSSQVTPVVTPPIFSSSLPSSCPERLGDSANSTSSSKVRLSMSLDGKAEVVESSSSPARETPPRPASSGTIFPQQRKSLQRSQSAYSFGQPSHNSPTIGSTPFVPQLKSGRSRDVRTWEFACDPDARDELTTQAENESSGSAVAAISLLRSTSQIALKPNNNKRNAPSAKHDAAAYVKKAKLGRAQSSVARLQTTDKPAAKLIRPNKGDEGLMRSPSGDSDKENWVPGEEGSHARRRPLPSSRPDNLPNAKAILGDNHKIMTHAGNLGGSKNRRRKGAYVEPKIFEDQENEGGEVEKFMRGDVSPSKKGDLDCIQGLLSLSQGNWR